MFSAASVCLSVSLFVCQHDNFQTIKRRMMKLGGEVHCTKISSEFECQGERSKVKVIGDKKCEKVLHFVRESSSGARSLCNIFSRAVLGSLLRRWENRHMLSSLPYFFLAILFACLTSDNPIISGRPLYAVLGFQTVCQCLSSEYF